MSYILQNIRFRKRLEIKEKQQYNLHGQRPKKLNGNIFSQFLRMVFGLCLKHFPRYRNSKRPTIFFEISKNVPISEAAELIYVYLFCLPSKIFVSSSAGDIKSADALVAEGQSSDRPTLPAHE